MSRSVYIHAASVALLICSLAGAQVPKVGNAAPSFVAKSHLNKDVSFPPKGAWAVLAFYPRAGTPG